MPGLRPQKAGKRVRLFSEYCGLGKSTGAAEHATDQACKEHDEEYQEMIDAGINPYWKWNEADEKFMQKIKKIRPRSNRERFVRWAAEKVFGFKRYMTGTSFYNWHGATQAHESSRRIPWKTVIFHMENGNMGRPGNRGLSL